MEREREMRARIEVKARKANPTEGEGQVEQQKKNESATQVKKNSVKLGTRQTREKKRETEENPSTDAKLGKNPVKAHRIPSKQKRT